MTDFDFFRTDRLNATNWRIGQDAHWPGDELVHAVVALLTPAVTKSLLPEWQGEYTMDRTRRWIEERDAESTVLAVRSIPNDQLVGLLLLAIDEIAPGSREVRLGYLIAESAWGRGLATELVMGLVAECRGLPGRFVIYAGLDRDNVASARVLEKCGFEPVVYRDAVEIKYRLEIA